MISRAACGACSKFCGLEFEPQCIEFHKTVRSVRTASSEQVRQPLNRDGLEQWRTSSPGSARCAPPWAMPRISYRS